MKFHELTADLKRDEGFVRHAYQDHLGFWTIGIGRLIDKRRDGGISEAEAEHLLGNDIKAVIVDLDRSCPWWTALSDPRQRALANMCFNLGLSRLLGFRKMLAALEAGDFAGAATEALDSRWARQVGDRAQRIATLLSVG